jgi:hypothetical protein
MTAAKQTAMMQETIGNRFIVMGPFSLVNH